MVEGIIGLLETWVEDQSLINHVLPDFDRYFFNAVKRSKFGRPMAGLVVYINRSISKYIKRISEETSFEIFLIIDKALFQSEKHVLLCFVYLPPTGSPFYS